MKKPRVKDREIRIEEIQKAAKDVFIRRGFQNASMDEIARKAGVSKGTLYLYFKDKGNLYISLMVPATREQGNMLRAFRTEVERGKCKNARDILMGLHEVHRRLHQYDPDGIRIIQAYLQGEYFDGLSKETRDILDRIGREDYQATRTILSQAIEQGLMRNVNPVQLTDIIWAMFIGIVQVEESKRRTTKKNHLPETLELAFSLLADALNREHQEAGFRGSNPGKARKKSRLNHRSEPIPLT
jgi:AcrR family transcriptional regulator